MSKHHRSGRYTHLRKVGGWNVIDSGPDDVVVPQRPGNPHVLYLLGTPATSDQFSIGTRDEAVTQAVAFARQQRVRAWFDNGDNSLLLLGTFSEEHERREVLLMAKPGNSTTRRAEAAAAVGRLTVPGPNGSAPVTDADVARRAYDLYLARGREPGHDVEDWLQAERDLRGAVDFLTQDPLGAS